MNINLTPLEGATGLYVAGWDLGSIIYWRVLPYIFAGAGVLLLLYLLLGGFQLMTSGGDPKGVQAAREKITAALIGFVIVFAAYWIAQAAGLLLGLKDIQETFKQP